jgi:hypothetical protein
MDGVRWRETVRAERRPVGDYLALQGRFAQLDDAAIAALQTVVDADAAFLAERFRAGETL